MIKKQKFKRTAFNKYSKLGVRRKKKQVYRKGKGTDNKMRLNKRGRLRKVKSGFGSEKSKRYLIEGKNIKLIHNLEDLKNIKNDEIGIIAKLGQKKKIDLVKYALENKIQLSNVNSKKYLEETEGKIKKLKEEKLEKEEENKIKEKKAKELAKTKEKKEREDKEKIEEDKKEEKMAEVKKESKDKSEKIENKEEKLEKIANVKVKEDKN